MPGALATRRRRIVAVTDTRPLFVHLTAAADGARRQQPVPVSGLAACAGS
jgi:hypothetical protein